MEITEVRVVLKDSPDKKLKAYTTVTFDNVFVVRNIKVIEGSAGLFIAMPSRKVKYPCPKCSFKNELRSKFCNQCAAALPAEV
ncbi:MAG: septation protein SpoVG family protein, partial [Candidatus Omnitrophica bacterium]|nr:septation protein SpoVG family protein [Candidatus Omnitrophota bacterium]